MLNDKKFLWWRQTFFIYMIDFLFQIKILLINMLKLLKIPGFLMIFVQNSRFFLNFQNFRFFSLNCQIPGFSRYTGLLATYDGAYRVTIYCTLLNT